MADTTNKSLQRPPNGSNIDVWDVPLNANFTTIDQALGGYTSLVATGVTAYALTSAQYVPPVIFVSGGQSASVVYTIPAGVGGQWIIQNTTSDSAGGPWLVSFKSGGGATTINCPRGVNTTIFCDGVSVYSSTTFVPTGGGADKIFFNNGQTVTVNYSIPSGSNSGTFGPVTIASGVTVTIPSGSYWTVT